MTEPRPDGQEPPCCFDTWAHANAKRARRRGIAAKLTEHLVDAIDDEGLEGRTVLDLGCGTGDLALATVARGARHATGIDLGTGAIADARALARERGLGERAEFVVGDGSSAPLEGHDVVALNRVFCCFQRADALLRNSLGAARSVYAFTIPTDRGVRGLINRTLSRLANVWYSMRGSKIGHFRSYVHDIAWIERAVAEAGFVRDVSERRSLWYLAVWRRDGAADRPAATAG